MVRVNLNEFPFLLPLPTSFGVSSLEHRLSVFLPASLWEPSQSKTIRYVMRGDYGVQANSNLCWNG